MKFNRIILLIICSSFLYSCADYQINKSQKVERKYYTSTGFALIYDDDLFKQKIIKEKINNENIKVMHRTLKKNTPIKLINPINTKVIETKIYRKTDYPNIFNIIISKKAALILELDFNNPYIEITEIKKNKTFVAQKSNTFDEEKNVAEKAPVEEIMVDDLSRNDDVNNDEKNNENFVLVINDFYFKNSAINLKNELIKKTKMTNIFVKKINDKKYRLLVGPFENFNALKKTYISLSNLGFGDLNIYKN